MEHHLGRLIDHVHLRTADLEKAKRFYRAVLEALGRGAAIGNNIEAVFHGSAKRSAASVVVTA